MNKINIGILGCADIAKRMVAPAIIKNQKYNLKGIASRDQQQAEIFSQNFGGRVYGNYDELIASPEIDAVYIPLPPSFHFEWGRKALEMGKHILLEKPSTTSLKDTLVLIEEARKRNLAILENYMFENHQQIKYIKDLISNDEIGEVRLVRGSFGFPLRHREDFRYSKELGGGALLDCGGYPIKLAKIFLGDDLRVTQSQLNNLEGYEVDMHGSGVITNKDGLVCQIAFGFDNFYQCNCEIWGQKGKITANRIFTAPPNYSPKITIEKQMEKYEIELMPDNHFDNTLEVFYEAITTEKKVGLLKDIELQARLVDEMRIMAEIQ